MCCAEGSDSLWIIGRWLTALYAANRRINDAYLCMTLATVALNVSGGIVFIDTLATKHSTPAHHRGTGPYFVKGETDSRYTSWIFSISLISARLSESRNWSISRLLSDQPASAYTSRSGNCSVP